MLPFRYNAQAYELSRDVNPTKSVLQNASALSLMLAPLRRPLRAQSRHRFMRRRVGRLGPAHPPASPPTPFTARAAARHPRPPPPPLPPPPDPPPPPFAEP